MLIHYSLCKMTLITYFALKSFKAFLTNMSYVNKSKRRQIRVRNNYPDIFDIINHGTM